MKSDTEKIHALIEQYCRAALQKDPDAMLQLYDGDVRIFDLWDRASVRGTAEWSPLVRHWLGSLGPETVHVAFEQIEVQVERDLAVLTAFVHYQARDPAGTVLREMTNRLTWSLARREPGCRAAGSNPRLSTGPRGNALQPSLNSWRTRRTRTAVLARG